MDQMGMAVTPVLAYHDQVNQQPGQERRDRPKRKMVSNACEHCRASKSKCSGKAPCARCVNADVQCIFMGRAHQRAQRELFQAEQHLVIARNALLESEDRLVALQAQLQNSENNLTALQMETLVSRQDLTTSQLDLMAFHKLAREQQHSLDNIFHLLQLTPQGVDQNLGSLARGSTDTHGFWQAIAVLATQSRLTLTQECTSSENAATALVLSMPSPAVSVGSTASPRARQMPNNNLDDDSESTGCRRRIFAWQSDTQAAGSSACPEIDLWQDDSLVSGVHPHLRTFEDLWI